MFLSLVFKEIKSIFSGDKFSKDKVLNTILSAIVSIFFIVIEISLYTMLNNRLSVYKGASVGFLTIFLFIISIIMTLYTTFVFRKTLFNEDDNKVLITKPIDPTVNVISKVLFTYLKCAIVNLLVTVPILVVYGIGLKLQPRFFFLMSVYPFFISLFECGLACILTIAYQPIYKFLKQHYVIQSIISVLIIITLCLGYSYVLNLFLKLVQSNSLLSIFTTESINNFNKVAYYLIPIRFYIDAISGQYEGILYTLLVTLPVLIVGVTGAQLMYRYFIKREADQSSGRKPKHYVIPKVTSVRKTLLKKELQLLFNSNDMFSYTGLFVMQPFLTILIINAMNIIFSTGALSYVVSYFPYVSGLIHIIFILLFSGYINTSCSAVISKEGANGIRICKTIPVSYKEQILIKMAVPFACSLVSLVITCLSLTIFGQITFENSVYGFLLALEIDALLEIILVSSDLNNNESFSKKANSNSYIELVAILLPVVIVIVMFLLTYAGLPMIITFVILFLVLAGITIGIGFKLLSHIGQKFLLLEMRT